MKVRRKERGVRKRGRWSRKEENDKVKRMETDNEGEDMNGVEKEVREEMQACFNLQFCHQERERKQLGMEGTEHWRELCVESERPIR